MTDNPEAASEWAEGDAGTGAARARTAWWRRRWVQLVAAVAVAGAVGFGSGQSTGVSPEAQRRIDAAEQHAEAEAGRADAAQAARDRVDDTVSQRSSDLDDRETSLDQRESGLDTREQGLNTREQGLDSRETAVSAAERAAKANSFAGDGIYLIGTDIQPGTYRAKPSPSGSCYYAILNSLDGSLDAIRENNNVAGQVVLQVPADAKAVEVSGCAEFARAR